MPAASDAPKLAVLITCDQFPTAAVGCYGNDWVDTTAIDTLAAEGFVFDRCLANRIDESGTQTAERLARQIFPLLQQGIRLIVVEEAELPSVATMLPEAEFRTCPAGRFPPESAADLPFISLLKVGRELFAELALAPQSTLLWLRSAGMSPEAIPPAEAFELYAEELEELATSDAESTDEAFVEHPAVRAAYVSLLDFALGQFCDELRQSAQPILLQWTAFQSWPWVSIPRATPVLGELEAARIHVPLVLWERGKNGSRPSGEPGRSMALVQTSDLSSCLFDWMTSREHMEEPTGIWSLIQSRTSHLRDYAVTLGFHGAVSIWTPEDQVVFASVPTTESSESPPVQRFWQPDDPWNVFDASGGSSERIAELARTFAIPANLGSHPV